jgi:hypothetical protein
MRKPRSELHLSPKPVMGLELGMKDGLDEEVERVLLGK